MVKVIDCAPVPNYTRFHFYLISGTLCQHASYYPCIASCCINARLAANQTKEVTITKLHGRYQRDSNQTNCHKHTTKPNLIAAVGQNVCLMEVDALKIMLSAVLVG